MSSWQCSNVPNCLIVFSHQQTNIAICANQMLIGRRGEVVVLPELARVHLKETKQLDIPDSCWGSNWLLIMDLQPVPPTIKCVFQCFSMPINQSLHYHSCISSASIYCALCMLSQLRWPSLVEHRSEFTTIFQEDTN